MPLHVEPSDLVYCEVAVPHDYRRSESPDYAWPDYVRCARCGVFAARQYVLAAVGSEMRSGLERGCRKLFEDPATFAHCRVDEVFGRG